MDIRQSSTMHPSLIARRDLCSTCDAKGCLRVVGSTCLTSRGVQCFWSWHGHSQLFLFESLRDS